MALTKITYDTKVTLSPQPSVANVNKVTDADMNEIKSVVNDAIDQIDTNTTKIENATTYSTTEQVIGTWIDGKPLYSRWYSKTISSGTQNTLLNINRNDYGVIWVNKGFSDSSNSKSVIGTYYYASNDFQRIHIEQGNQVIWQRGSSYPVLPLTIYYELRYTKTTD